MEVFYDYLQDQDFLIEMDNSMLREHFVKITALDWEENPIQEFQGVVTGGTISLSGSSSLRRTCNLSAFLPKKELTNITNVNNFFSINKKVFIEIGLTNTTDKYLDYPIIWYPQGTFVIITPTITHSLNGVALSLQTQDKMCLLNGTCGGVLPASVQFDEYETLDPETGVYYIDKPVISQIIREGINHFGGEQLSKIAISDVDDVIKMTMKWTGSSPLYFIQDEGLLEMTTDYAKTEGKSYTMYSYGEDVGYTLTSFTYPGELIQAAGTSIAATTELIKNKLGNYEQFYDTSGTYIFREQKNFLTTTQATSDTEKLLNNADYIVDMNATKSVYSFENSKLITSYSNAPQFNKIKNDFVIWGERESVLGNKIPIRYHLAIDEKPEIGNIYEVFLYEDPDDDLIKAKSFIKVANYSDLLEITGSIGVFYLDENSNIMYKWDGSEYTEVDFEVIKVKTTDWRSELYLQGVVAEPYGLESNYYYSELITEWPKLYDLTKNSYEDGGDTIYTGDFHDTVLSNLSGIDYFLDFVDSTEAISQFNVSNIGRRSHVETKTSLNCVFAPTIPDYVLIESGVETTEEKRLEAESMNQPYIQVNSIVYANLTTGGSLNSIFDAIKSQLYNSTSYNENIQLQSMPIYHLEPNSRITVRDTASDMFGDYIIGSITLPLNSSGVMSITAARAIDTL